MTGTGPQPDKGSSPIAKLNAANGLAQATISPPDILTPAEKQSAAQGSIEERRVYRVEWLVDGTVTPRYAVHISSPVPQNLTNILSRARKVLAAQHLAIVEARWLYIRRVEYGPHIIIEHMLWSHNMGITDEGLIEGNMAREAAKLAWPDI